MQTISVIIPVFNCAQYVGLAIESVLKQSLLPTEIIVVDDGSTDQSPEIAKRYPVCYLRKTNGGPSSARNAGIRAAQGAYVAFLDADDVWLDGKLETQIKALERFPEASFSFSTIWHFNDGKNTQPTSPYYPHELSEWIRTQKTTDDAIFGNVYRILLSSNCVDTCSVVAKRHALVEAGLFDESLSMGEDHDLWLRLSRKHPAVFMLNPTSRYRIHNASLTGSLAARPDVFYQSNIRVLEKHFAMFPSSSVRKALADARVGFALFLLKSGQRAHAGELAVRSFRDWPNSLAIKVCVEAACPRFYSFLSHARHYGRGAFRQP